jgi:hypothetical protein
VWSAGSKGITHYNTKINLRSGGVIIENLDCCGEWGIPGAIAKSQSTFDEYDPVSPLRQIYEPIGICARGHENGD